MKKLIACILPAFVLFFASSIAGRADLFNQIQSSPNTYWVPAPTPPPPGVVYYHYGQPGYGYVGGPPPYYYGAPYYYGPPAYYYGPPPPRVYYDGTRLFFCVPVSLAGVGPNKVFP